MVCWAVPAMVWQRSTQAARMAAQSTAMAGAVANSIRQAPVQLVSEPAKIVSRVKGENDHGSGRQKPRKHPLDRAEHGSRDAANGP
jgi:hypothetical protein